MSGIRENKRSMIRYTAVLMIAVMTFCLTGMNTDSEVYAKAKKPGAVKSVKLAKKTASTLTIKWKKASGAKKYQIQYKQVDAKKYKKATSGKTSYTIKKLQAGSKYAVMVRGMKGKKGGKWSSAVTFITDSSNVKYAKASNESKLKVSASENKITVTISALGKKKSGTLYSMGANQYFSKDKLKGIVKKGTAGTKIGTFKMNKAKTFTFDRYTDSGYDRVYDKYYVISSGKVVRGPVYAAKIAAPDNKVKFDTVTKKGIIDELDDDSFAVAKDIKSGWTAVNIDFTALILANETEGGTPVDNSASNADKMVVNGKTYYFNRPYVNQIDSRLSQYEKMGINAVAVCVSFVSTESSNRYPRSLKYIDDARWTNGFNTSNTAGREYFIACMEYLAKRYSEGGHGRICNYVIGNEIDFTYDWYEILPNKSKSGKKLPARGDEMQLRSGEIEVKAPFETFMEEYSRTLRLANLAVKKYSNDIKVGIGFSRAWAESRAMNAKCDPATSKRYDSYIPKDMLGWLNYYTKKQGDYDWTLTPHNYPEVSGDAAAYETGVTGGKVRITGDINTTPIISQNNLELLQLFLNKGYNKCGGKLREIYFTENGSSSGEEIGTPSVEEQKKQAACIAQYYYRASSMPSVKAIIYYKKLDRAEEGASSFKLGLKDTNGKNKLSYDVWKYVDTNRSFEVSDQYLDSITFKKGGKIYSKANGKIKSYLDVMKMTSSGYNWNKSWNVKAMTPVNA